MARTQAYSDEQIMDAIRAKHGLVYLAAKKLHCSPVTIYKRINSVPKVAEVVKEERGLFVDTAEEKLYEAVKRGDSWAVCFTLKCQGKDRGYIEKMAVLHGGDDSAPPIKTEPSIPLDRISLSVRKALLAELDRIKEEDEKAGGLNSPSIPKLTNGRV